MGEQTYDVAGMSCGGCERAVENALGDLPGIQQVHANHETDSVRVVAEGSVNEQEIRSHIDAAGYETR